MQKQAVCSRAVGVSQMQHQYLIGRGSFLICDIQSKYGVFIDVPIYSPTPSIAFKGKMISVNQGGYLSQHGVSGRLLPPSDAKQKNVFFCIIFFKQLIRKPVLMFFFYYLQFKERTIYFNTLEYYLFMLYIQSNTICETLHALYELHLHFFKDKLFCDFDHVKSPKHHITKKYIKKPFQTKYVFHKQILI